MLHLLGYTNAEPLCWTEQERKERKNWARMGTLEEDQVTCSKCKDIIRSWSGFKT